MVRCRDSAIRVESVQLETANGNGSLSQKELLHFEPIVDTLIARHAGIVRRVVEDALAFETPQLTRIIVDEVVRAQDALVAAVDDVRGGDEGKVLREPTVLRLERGRNFHRRRRDEDLIVHLESMED